MKKVLFITYYWPPSGKASLHWPLDMIKYLPEYNWHPAVLTAKEDTFSQKDESLLKKIDPSLVVIRTNSPEPFNFYKKFLGKKKDESLVASETISQAKKGIKHQLAIWIRMNLFVPDARIGWYLPSVREGKIFLTSNYLNSIVSVGPPHTAHLIGRKLSRAFNIPHVPVFIDPWTDIIYYKNFKRNKITLAIDNHLEKSVLLHAQKVIFITEAMRNDYIQKYPWLENKSNVLYWGYNEEEFIDIVTAISDTSNQALKSDSERINTLKESSEEILLHAGNIFDYQNPKALWNLIRQMISNGRKIKIKFIGTVGPEIKISIAENGLESVTEYVGFLSYKNMLTELCKANYLMVCASEPRHVPGKLFEYLRTGKPIIAFGDGNEEVKEILTKANAGMLFSYAEDGHEFFENLSNFKTDELFVKKFDRKNITRELSKIIT